MRLEQELKDIKFTAKQQDLFEKLNIKTINDLISKYPSRYNFIIETELIDNAKVVVEGKIISEVKIAFYQGKKNRIYFDILYNDNIVKVVIFNRAFMLANLKKANVLTIMGLYTQKNNTIIASEIKLSDLKKIEGIYPIYSLNNLYKNADYIKLVRNVLEKGNLEIENIIMDENINKYQLMNRQDAINKIHFPNSQDELFKANRTLIYEEFFMFALHSIILNNKRKSDSTIIKEIDSNDIVNMTNELNYKLTNDQRKVLNDIYIDFKSPYAMKRLLLADVGSGKTLVAFVASYMIYMAGYQTAFMAPTTILAMQHYQSALEVFANIEINIALLTSNTNPQERECILSDLKKGKIDLIIGTHALYQEDVIFKNLGFVIYDEQQRFGVKQRQQLKEKGKDVEQLMLSATPIPRTLAQVAYSSIQVSYMKEPLPFKKPIKSYYYKNKSIKPFYEQIISFLKQKQQIYIVTPLIEESENIDTKNVVDVYQNIKSHFIDEYKVGLIHGKLDNDTKQEVMDKFISHEYDILVATSLIEVGISVSNATCIVIYDAHRFGLSQLHQLRGRVGRGSLQGHCVFLSSSNDLDTIAKMEFMANTNDGFEIAEYDLKTRGPGDILGIKQSGLPSFNLANPLKDEKIYTIAYQDALNLYNNKEEFEKWYLKHQDTIKSLELITD